jgi:lipopolysaccharide transport system permease protein
VISVLVQLLFFLTPITYPPSRVPGFAKNIMQWNPMAMIVDNFGRVVNDGRPPNWTEWTIITLASALLAIGGYAWFMKIKRAFADVI